MLDHSQAATIALRMGRHAKEPPHCCIMAGEDHYKAQRVRKREALKEMGIDPYGGRFPDVTATTAVREQAEQLAIEPGQRGELRARVAGRIMLLRPMGKLAFITVRDGTGTIQLGLSKAELGDQWAAIKQLDLGDIIGADGTVGRTKTGELTLWAERFTLLAKSLLPPPEKWHGLTDVDLRYRRRYVDLFTNPEVREVFRQRSAIIQAVRQCLLDAGYCEVETPVLQPMYGGAAARPFTTHHNTLDMRLFLRISPELYLKRLLVGGVERVFEVSRNFRNEGISTKHNPEFTMIELYEAYGDYTVMMERVEQMVSAAFNASARRSIPERAEAIEQEVARLKADRADERAASYAQANHLAAYRRASEGIEAGRLTTVFCGKVLDFTPPWPPICSGSMPASPLPMTRVCVNAHAGLGSTVQARTRPSSSTKSSTLPLSIISLSRCSSMTTRPRYAR
ncbi:MAG: amino acid--tRNA ligase-related protein [Phycisphaerae bacterium]